ncbi:hypothetical protein VNO78_19103 [Psophocarpus tetragonolobus]|uniref:Uncharacterized protein n=1 Tax=Psophocarpus tetragonolobus TaxID=3891 RepID=A0AAN9S7V8_PSOTE
MIWDLSENVDNHKSNVYDCLWQRISLGVVLSSLSQAMASQLAIEIGDAKDGGTINKLMEEETVNNGGVDFKGDGVEALDISNGVMFTKEEFNEHNGMTFLIH